jgi:hypothetical protein
MLTMSFISYFPKCAFLQGDWWKNQKNLDILKLEIRVEYKISFHEHFYIVIWLCMLLEYVLEILHLLMPKTLIDQFVFVWGR